MDLAAVTGFVSGIPLDWIVLGALIIILTVDSLRSGIGRATAIALALPVTFLLFSLLKTTAVISSMEALFASAPIQAGIFGVIGVLSYLMLRRMGIDYMMSGAGQPIQAVIAAVGVTIIVLVVWLQIPELSGLWQMSDYVQAFFAQQYRLFWLVGSYAALVFARG